jgi:signal peptidase II
MACTLHQPQAEEVREGVDPYRLLEDPAPGIADDVERGRAPPDPDRSAWHRPPLQDRQAPGALPSPGTAATLVGEFPPTCHTGPMPVNTRCVAVLAGTALLGIGLDQATKALVAATLEGKPPVRVVGRVLTIYVSRNSGAAFSFAAGATVLFTCLAVAIAVLIVTKVPRLSSASWAAALGLLLAGAVGNLCDRLLRAPGFGRGAVVDFIDLQHFADFNIADSCLTCGAVLAVLLSLRGIPLTGKSRGAGSAPARRARQ